jgi:prepilin-type N-terminal cleavage/methylation domain-containing protein
MTTRRGLTLLEVVVVIAIIGVLLALLLPGVQMARESARRAKCCSQLKQIGLAMQSYEATHRVLPQGVNMGYSFLVPILPQLERSDLYDQVDFRSFQCDSPDNKLAFSKVELFVCPSDGFNVASLSRKNVCGASNYAGNMGYDWLTFGYNGAFHSWSPAEIGFLKSTSATDGTAQTVAVSEILVAGSPEDPRRTVFNTAAAFPQGAHEAFCRACLDHELEVLSNGQIAADGRRGWRWYVGEPATTLYTHSLSPNQISCKNHQSGQDGAFTAASNHPQGEMSLFLDGHVSFISSSINVRVWRAMGTRNGKDQTN